MDILDINVLVQIQRAMASFLWRETLQLELKGKSLYFNGMLKWPDLQVLLHLRTQEEVHLEASS